MTDHQQAAIEAGARALFVMQHRVSENVFDKGDYKALKDAAIRESTNALAAAEPHLRRKWAEEVREKVNPPDVDYSHEWRRGFTVGAIKAARFVEGAGNE